MAKKVKIKNLLDLLNLREKITLVDLADQADKRIVRKISRRFKMI